MEKPGDVDAKQEQIDSDHAHDSEGVDEVAVNLHLSPLGLEHREVVEAGVKQFVDFPARG